MRRRQAGWNALIVTVRAASTSWGRAFVNARSCSRLLLAAIGLSGAANAIEPIPAEPGWSGFVTLGVGGLSAETNMVAGIDRYGINIGNPTRPAGRTTLS